MVEEYKVGEIISLDMRMKGDQKRKHFQSASSTTCGAESGHVALA